MVQVYEVGLDYFHFAQERTDVASSHSGEVVTLTSPKHCPQTYLLDSSKNRTTVVREKRNTSHPRV